MVKGEGKLIFEEKIEKVPMSSSQTKAKNPSPFVDERVYFLLGSSKA